MTPFPPGRRAGAQTGAAALALALGLTAGAPAGAEGGLPAIGRIFSGNVLQPGQAICTGTLVAPDLVLTAAHCVHHAAANPGALRFEAGRDGTRIAAAGQGAEVIVAPADPEVPPLVADVALLRLAQPIPARVVPPLPVAAPDGVTFTRIGYTRADPDTPRAAPCGLLAAERGLLGLACAAESGHSGAPLLARKDGGWVVVAVFVAAVRIAGIDASYAVLPPAAFRLTAR